MLIRTAVCLSLILLGAPRLVAAKPYPKGKVFNVAFLTDGSGSQAKAFVQLVQKEIRTLTKGEFQVAFPEAMRVHADRTAKGIAAAGERLLADPSVNLLVTVGPLASHLMALRETFLKPVIAGHIVDPEAQGVPFKAGKSGKKNLTYVTSTLNVVRAIHGFRRLLPLKHLTMLLPRGYGAAFPSIGEKIQQMLGATGVKVTWLEADGPLEAVLPKIPAQCDGLVLLAPPGAREVPLDKLVKELKERRLPTFSPFGVGPVKHGILAGYNMEENQARMTRRVALNVQRVLMGEEPAIFGVKISYGAPVLHINMLTADAIGYRPGWGVLSEAVLIGRKRAATVRELTLDAAVRQGLEANLTLIAAHNKVEAGIYEVRKALARWAPAVTLSANAAFIDGDRASPLFGSFERSVTGSAQVSQLLFAEQALANVSIQKSLQRSREQELEQVKLDILSSVASAYVNLLKARANERLRKANLKVTKKHLELARVRQSIGSSSMADVYRWTAQLANDKKNVIRAITMRNQAEINLNGLRRRPLEESFTVPEGGLAGKRVWSPGSRIRKYIRNPWDFAAMREFMVREGLNRAPELKQLDRAIEAQKRSYLSTKLDFVVPSLAFRFNVDHRFHGSPDDSGAPPSIPGLSLGSQDETSWTAAFALSWPIFEGTAKYHRYRQARKELSRLKTQRADLAQQMEQRIRSTMHQAGSSFPGIKLSAEAATAAHKSLELVTEAYARGATSIIDLIEAQNATLSADLGAAMAFYDFYADFISAMRAIGNRDFFLYDEKKKDNWFDRLDRYHKSTRKGG